MKPASTSFFVTGGTLRSDAPSYVERKADIDLLDALRKGELCYVLTSRQMGKSSLMVQTASKLRAEGEFVSVLDLTGLGQNVSTEQWYHGLLTRTCRHIGLEDEAHRLWTERPHDSPLLRWTLALHKIVLDNPERRLTIFVDEIDCVRSLPFSTDEFFAAIRSFYNDRTEHPELYRLTFCLLGVASPTDLISNPEITPFNIGRGIQLNDFTRAEAGVLAHGLGNGREGAELIERVVYWTNGHPYLTQRLCAELSMAAPPYSVAAVDEVCRSLFLSHPSSDQDANLNTVRDRFLLNKKSSNELLELYRLVLRNRKIEYDEADPLVTELMLSGIVRIDGDRLVVRNRIYRTVFDRDWIRSSFSGAFTRQQRQAFRRGALRWAGVAGAVFVGMGMLTWFAWKAERKAMEANAAANRTRKDLANLLVDSNLRIASGLVESGYAKMAEKLLQECVKYDPISANRIDWRYLLGQVHREQKVLAGHESGAICVATNPDNRTLITVSGDQYVRTFDRATGKELSRFHGGDESVRRAAVSHDNGLVAMGDDDRSLVVWRVKDGSKVAAIHGKGYRVVCLSFSPDDRFLATGGAGNTIHLWNPRTGDELPPIVGHSNVVSALAFSPDGRFLCSGSFDKTIKVWDLSSRTAPMTLRGHTGAIFDLQYTRDGRSIASASFDGTARLWDARSGKLLQTLQSDRNPVRAVTFAADGRHLATGGENGIVRVWDVASGKLLDRFVGHSKSIASLCFLFGDNEIASAGLDGMVRLWQLDTQAVMRIAPFPEMASSFVFSSDGNHAAVGTFNGTLVLWDRNLPSSIMNKEDSRIWAASFTPDGSQVATEDDAGQILFWSSTGGRPTPQFNGQPGHYHEIAFSPNGGRLAAAEGDRGVYLWDVKTKTPLLLPRGGRGKVTTLGFSRDGAHLAAGTDQGDVVVWNVNRGSKESEYTAHSGGVTSIGFAPDRFAIASCGKDKRLRFRDVLSGKWIDTLEGFADDSPFCTFSHDGETLAVRGTSYSVKLVSTKTGRETLSFENLPANPMAVVFGHDDEFLSAMLEDGSIRTWRGSRRPPSGVETALAKR